MYSKCVSKPFTHTTYLHNTILIHLRNYFTAKMSDIGVRFRLKLDFNDKLSIEFFWVDHRTQKGQEKGPCSDGEIES